VYSFFTNIYKDSKEFYRVTIISLGGKQVGKEKDIGIEWKPEKEWK